MSHELPSDTHFLFSNNYFSSPELLNYLMKHGLWAVSTLKKGSYNCPIQTNSELKRKGR